VTRRPASGFFSVLFLSCSERRAFCFRVARWMLAGLAPLSRNPRNYVIIWAPGAPWIGAAGRGAGVSEIFPSAIAATESCTAPGPVKVVGVRPEKPWESDANGTPYAATIQAGVSSLPNAPRLHARCSAQEGLRAAPHLGRQLNRSPVAPGLAGAIPRNLRSVSRNCGITPRKQQSRASRPYTLRGPLEFKHLTVGPFPVTAGRAGCCVGLRVGLGYNQFSLLSPSGRVPAFSKLLCTPAVQTAHARGVRRIGLWRAGRPIHGPAGRQSY